MDLFLDYANVSKTLTPQESMVCGKLCEVAKHFLLLKVNSLVNMNKNHPMLFSYSSDGTPVLTKKTIKQQVTEVRVSVRKGGSAQEYLM